MKNSSLPTTYAYMSKTCTPARHNLATSAHFLTVKRYSSQSLTSYSTRIRIIKRTLHDLSPRCQEVFITKPGAQYHLLVVHETEGNRHLCTFCDEKFSTWIFLEKHVKAKHSANDERHHSCTLPRCEKTFPCSITCMLHEINDHLQDKTCDRCPEIFLTKPGTRFHLQTAHEIGGSRHLCTFCDKRFYTWNRLKKHVETRHSEHKEPLLSCKCGYKTSVKARFESHCKRKHGIGGEKGYECYFCGKKFFTFYELNSHCGRKHTMEKQL